MITTDKAYKACFKWAARAIAALVVVFALNSRVEIIEEVHPFESALGCMLMQFAYSFADFGIMDVLGLIAVIMLFGYIEKLKIKHNRMLGILSIILASLYLICLSFYRFDDMTYTMGNTYQKFLFLFNLAGYTIFIYSIVRILFYYFDNNAVSAISMNDDVANAMDSEKCKTSCTDDLKLIWKRSAVVIFLCWLPWMLMDYPGTFCRDSIDQLKQFFGYAEWSTHQPPFSTLIIGVCAGIGNFLGSTNLGVFLYILLHVATGVIIFSYSISVIRKLGASKRICMLCTLFYAVIPVWGIYVQWIEKSFLYNELIVLFSTLLVEIVSFDDIGIKKLIIFGCSGLLASFIRNNGIYVVVPTIVVLLFLVRKQTKRIVAGIIISVIVIFGLVTKILYPVLNIENGSSAEAFSIPFMQTARYVVSYGDEVMDEERTAIDGVLIYDMLVEKYDPVISDPVKLLYKNDSSKLPAYFKEYIRMFFKHPNIYVSAFINKNYAFLAPCKPVMEVGMDYGEEEWLAGIGIKHAFKELPVKFFDMIHTGITRWPLFKYFTMPGLYVWLVVLFIINNIRKKRFRNLVIYLPAVITILVCFAGPSQDLRFILSVTGSMPVFFVYELVYRKSAA